jgi:hypothetical protein
MALPYEQHREACNESAQAERHGHKRLRFLLVELAFHRVPACVVAGIGLSYKVYVCSKASA